VTKKIKILGQRLSPFVERIYLQVQVKGLADKIELERTTLEEIKQPAYMALNPLGKMPTMKMGKFILYESAVIQEFLEETFPKNPLLPKAPEERAKVRLLIRILDLYYHPNTVALMFQLMKKERDPKRVDFHIGEAQKALRVIESLIGTGRYFQGNSMTLADITLFASIYLGLTFAPHFKQDYFKTLPKLEAWYKKMQLDPIFANSNKVRGKEMAEYMTGLIALKGDQ